jgi:predicted secreted acid phosphatase
LGEDGMGREILLAFLHDIPGIHKSSLDHQLVNLKASGDYARLIAEVQQEIAAEQAAADAQELAHRAAEAAAMKYVAKGILTGDDRKIASSFHRPTLAGTVAAAMKYVAKCILTGKEFAPEIWSNFDHTTVRAFTALAAATVCFLVAAPVPLRWRLSTVSRISART